MARLIDAEKLLQKLTTVVSTVKEGILYYNSVYNIVNEQPTVDIMEVIERENRKYNEESQTKPKTNYDKIRNMTLEEMAIYLCSTELPICPLQDPHCRDNNCSKCFEEWLKSEESESKKNDEL